MINEAIPSISVTLLPFTEAENLAKRAFSHLKATARLSVVLWEEEDPLSFVSATDFLVKQAFCHS